MMEQEEVVSNPISETAGSGGKNSKEYRAIQTNLDRIVASLKQKGALLTVARRIFQERRISIDILEDVSTSKMDAVAFIIETLKRIEFDEQDFYIFVRALSTVPNLVKLSDQLKAIVGSDSESMNLKDSSTSLGDQVKPGSLDSTSLKIDAETATGNGDVRDAKGVESFASIKPDTKHKNLPPSSAYNIPKGVMNLTAEASPQPQSEAGITGDHNSIDIDIDIDSECSSGEMYMTPIAFSGTDKNSKHELLVNGANQRSSVLEVQQELEQYQARLDTAEQEIKQLKDRDSSGIRQNLSLDLDLTRQKKSMTFHQERLKAFEERLKKLEGESIEMKENLETSLTECSQKIKSLENEVTLTRKESSQASQEMQEKLESMKLESQALMDKKLAELKDEIQQSKKEIDTGLISQEVVADSGSQSQCCSKCTVI